LESEKNEFPKVVEMVGGGALTVNGPQSIV